MIKQWLEPEPDWVPLRQAVDRDEAQHRTIEAMILARARDPARRKAEEAMIAIRQAERPFNRAVLEGKVMIFARPGALSNPFERVGRDVWRRFSIDQGNEYAVAPDGAKFYALHAKMLARPQALKATIRDENAAIAMLAELLKHDNDLRRRDALEQCRKHAEYVVSIRGFQSRIWPQARVKAGLPAIAPRGRKRKKF